MDQKNVRVLLVEDNPADARLVQELLKEVHDVPFDLEWVEELSTALDRLAEGQYGAVLLDLTLPDSQGLESLRRMHAEQPEVPIIVTTGMEEEALALMAVQEGAHDYLVKSLLDGKSLVRSLCYAIERNRMLTELELDRQQEQHDRELAAMEQAICAFQAALGSESTPPLREGQAEAFAELTRRYGDLMDAALARRAYKVEHNLTDRLRAIADSAGATILELYNNPKVTVPDYRSMDPLLLHVAFAVEDVAAERDRLVAAGAMVVEDVGFTDAGDELAMLRDPWGVPVQLMKRADPML